MAANASELIRAADRLEDFLSNLVRKGFGYALFFCGIASGGAAVALRIVESREVTTAVFFGILGGAVFLIALAALFFAVSVRSELDQARDLAEKAAELRRQAAEADRLAGAAGRSAADRAGFDPKA